MILILGYGISGKAAASLLRIRGIPFIAVDKKPEEGVLSDSADLSLDGFTQVILSPGVPPTHPLVLKAVQMGLEVVGEMEYALRLTPNRCVGITGSNGKTTTTLLAAHALNANGVQAKAVGNVGLALSTYLLDPDPEEILIIELSSFQLETLREKKFEMGAILNLFPNHLNRHASMEEYVAAKMNLQRCLKPNGKLLVSEQAFPICQAHLQPGILEIFCSEKIRPEQLPQFIAEQNIAAAERIAASFGVGREAFLATLPMFEKPPHRLEWVATKENIHYYNDSKASSVEAVNHAISWFSQPVVLIVGGVDKGSPYHPWIESFRGKVKKVVAYGEASAKIQREIGTYYPLDLVTTLQEAVIGAVRSATSGDVVLLSPGCSSYDQFQSFEHRGDEFKRLVRETIGVRS